MEAAMTQRVDVIHGHKYSGAGEDAQDVESVNNGEAIPCKLCKSLITYTESYEPGYYCGNGCTSIVVYYNDWPDDEL